MIDKQYVINNVSNIEKLPNITILKMLMQFKEQLETSGAYHSITIGEVTTLEAEENAYVENVGTSTDLILNFGIPKGVGFNFSGEWVSGNNEYHPNDVVLFNGNLYICISTILDSETPPNIDTSHWSLFVGYGNDISEFVNNEYNKQKNKLNYRGALPSTQNGMTASFDEASGAIRFTGTPTSSYARVFGDVNTFLPAGDYVFSVLQSTGVNSVLRLTFEDNTTQDYYIVPQGVERKITATKNIIKYRIFLENIAVGREYDLMLYYQLEKGTKRTNWVKWYGESLNKIDITPVILWENATPNGEFAGGYKAFKQTINKGDIVRITYVQNSSSGESIPMIHEFIFSGVATGYLSLIFSINLVKYFRNRVFAIDSGGIDFRSGEGGQLDALTTNNNYCVPLKVELVNY